MHLLSRISGVTHTLMYRHLYIYIYMCVCVFLYLFIYTNIGAAGLGGSKPSRFAATDPELAESKPAADGVGCHGECLELDAASGSYKSSWQRWQCMPKSLSQFEEPHTNQPYTYPPQKKTHTHTHKQTSPESPQLCLV